MQSFIRQWPHNSSGYFETSGRIKKTIQETMFASPYVMLKSGLKPVEVIDLIPVKPIGENEGQIKEISRLN